MNTEEQKEHKARASWNGVAHNTSCEAASESDGATNSLGSGQFSTNFGVPYPARGMEFTPLKALRLWKNLICR